uniref:Testis cDNA, clone: QtsA-16375, similar to human Down syndrome critical region gene 9 (DSCR9) n=1 Tax=Macaca fascicularis TaxID=9541 RepID=Q4R745_MACFA|nr:unnamed protein product [Macaca fascicularis]
MTQQSKTQMKQDEEWAAQQVKLHHVTDCSPGMERWRGAQRDGQAPGKMDFFPQTSNATNTSILTRSL